MREKEDQKKLKKKKKKDIITEESTVAKEGGVEGRNQENRNKEISGI